MKRGYSLVELIIIVGVIASITVMISGIMINTFKANNKTIMMRAVDENGSWAMERIRQYILSNSASTIECVNNAGWQIKIKGAEDGSGVRCVGDINYNLGTIRSVDDDLIKENEAKVNCDTFGAECFMSGETVTGIGVSFYIFAGDTNSPGNFVSKVFNTKVTLRN
jgi:type II secretory pathway pseudopilin PulG